MAKVKLNPVLEKIQGQIGDLVFKRYGDEVVISRKADMSGRTPSAAQLAHQERFREAAMYGRMVMADPESKALYVDAAKAKGKPVYALMVADFFNAPSVDVVDVSGYSGAVGDEIVVMASDDFDVAEVQVALTTGDGTSIEAGAAVETPVNSGRWVYTTTVATVTGTAVRIAVTAVDRPGSMDSEEVDVTV